MQYRTSGPERVTQTPANNLSTDIKGVGTLVRDWVTPYYTLGGVTAFAITILSLIDRSGWLVRGVTAALVLLTLVVCAQAWTRSRAQPAADADTAKTGPKLHTTLVIISLFFGVGLLVSEALVKERHKGEAAQTPPAETATEKSATAPAAPAEPAAPAVVPTLTSATPAAHAAEPASAPAAPIPPTPPAAPATVTAAPAKPAPARAEPQEAAPKKAAKVTPAPAALEHSDTPRAKPAKASERAVLPARCSEITAQFSAGRSVSDADKQYLETSCR